MGSIRYRDPTTGQTVPVIGASSGVTDHGALTGLADDDHPQYVKDTGDTMTGDLTVSKTDPWLIQNMTGTSNAAHVIRRNGTYRWLWQTQDAETGNNTGSNLVLKPRTDGGANIAAGFALTINRATGLITVIGDPTADLGVATKKYVDGKVPADTAIPFGWVHWGSSSRGANWSRLVNADNYDVAGGMTYSNQALVAPSAGRYLATYTIQFTIAGTSCGGAVGTTTGNFEESQTYFETTNHAFVLSGSTLLNVAAGQSTGLWTFQSGGANVGWAWLYLARIGT